MLFFRDILLSDIDGRGFGSGSLRDFLFFGYSLPLRDTLLDIEGTANTFGDYGLFVSSFRFI
jgi:hypothetical protein